jgi:hypothetical protein
MWCLWYFEYFITFVVVWYETEKRHPRNFITFLTAVYFIPVSVFMFSNMITLGLVIFSWLYFQMDMDDYPHFSITDDGSLVSIGQHCPGFPRVLWEALIRLSYDRDVPLYCCCLSKAHGLDVCEVNVTISFYLVDPWIGIVVDSKLDTTVEQMAHVALTALCDSHLAATAEMLITLFLIRN